MISTEGIVIKEIRYSETSKILTIYTRKLGKISVMAKGAYNPKSRLIGLSQSFGYNDYKLKKGRNFYYINDGDVLKSFYGLREDIDKLMYGYYILELLEKSVPDEYPNERLFDFLKKALDVLLSSKDGLLKFIVGFELKFIAFLGYRPVLEACSNCGKEDLGALKFSISKGGIICEDCFREDQLSFFIREDIRKFLCQAMYSRLEDLTDLQISQEDLKLSHTILVNYILDKIDRKTLNSLDFIELL